MSILSTLRTASINGEGLFLRHHEILEILSRLNCDGGLTKVQLQAIHRIKIKGGDKDFIVANDNSRKNSVGIRKSTLIALEGLKILDLIHRGSLIYAKINKLPDLNYERYKSII